MKAEELKKIIEKSEMWYTASKLIDGETWEQMVDDLVNDINKASV